MYSLLAGVVCKIALNYILIGTPEINIHGAPIASLACYTISMVPNLCFVVKYAAKKFPVSDVVLRPLAASLVMGGAVGALWRFVFTDRYLHLGRARLILAVAACLVVGVAVYSVLAFALGAIKREDVPAKLQKKIWKRQSN
ncbi:MAG: polysaccharide biosynthesis C-terminal domain-containing protein [Clostridia bacterium]|nr:polysaccharide biosynthesis C-terminal domain-containing protein [Clostridia bacterium]